MYSLVSGRGKKKIDLELNMEERKEKRWGKNKNEESISYVNCFLPHQREKERIIDPGEKNLVFTHDLPL